jgi:hypothetical protein
LHGLAPSRCSAPESVERHSVYSAASICRLQHQDANWRMVRIVGEQKRDLEGHRKFMIDAASAFGGLGAEPNA